MMSSKAKTTGATEEATPALVPKLRFPEFRHAQGWNAIPLGDLLPITSSKRVHESDWTSEGVPFYRAREIVALHNRQTISPLFISEELYQRNAKATGEIAAGRRLAETLCSVCHRIDNRSGPREGPGPSFADIARMPSTTPLAISVFLQSSHNNMPNLILTQAEIDDVRSFILSLRDK